MKIKKRLILITLCILIGVTIAVVTLFVVTKKDGNQNKEEAQTQDTTPPIIVLGDSYVVKVGYEKSLTDVIMSADDIDQNPKREIIGDYDINTAGEYNLTYKIEDASGNVTLKEFVLKVREETAYREDEITFDDAVKKYKTGKTLLGIDVSKWQGEIDWKKVSNAGAEFAIIRFGYQNGFDGEVLEDPYLEKNIKGCEENNIPIAFYFSSYAKTKDEVINHVTLGIEVLKKYNYENTSVAFDWENWNSFNKLGISLNDINNIADTFMEGFSKQGYHPFLYGSKTYLESVWTNKNGYDIWLANYVSKTEYQNLYKIWQFTQTGKIDGISENVDINVMYKD